MWIAIIVAGWLLCSFLSYGLTLGYFDGKWPFFRHFRFAVLISTAGPVALIVALGFALEDGSLRFNIRPLSKQEAWLAHRRKWPSLSYEDFESSYRS